MTLSERIESFSELGLLLRDSLGGKPTNYTSGLERIINNQQLFNPWFTPGNVRLALEAIAGELRFENLIKWTDKYPSLSIRRDPVNVGVVMAGNIPLAGFHDFLTVLMTGNNIISKTSSKDRELPVFIAEMLRGINRGFAEKIRFTDDFLNRFDVVIATGGDNSSRYFEYYFRDYPHIIRKNRNSAAIIEGVESDTEMEALGTDIFSYFGLGCRSVSKIYLPAGYDLKKLASYWPRYSSVINHSKYANNYDYNKAIFMVNRDNFLDTGFVLMKENKSLASPVAVLYYEYYEKIALVTKMLQNLKEKIQCIAGRNHMPFGKAQYPRLWDYADGTDTMEFLLKKNIPGIL